MKPSQFRLFLISYVNYIYCNKGSVCMEKRNMKQETNIYKEKFKINLFGKEVGGNLMLFCTENLLTLV